MNSPPLPKRVNNEQPLLFFMVLKIKKKSRCTITNNVGKTIILFKYTLFYEKKSRKRVNVMVIKYNVTIHLNFEKGV